MSLVRTAIPILSNSSDGLSLDAARSVCRCSRTASFEARPNRISFAAGTTKARAWESPHNYGLAVDIIHGTKAWDLTRKQWEIVGHMGKEVAAQLGVKVVWGGDWKFYDPAHWELANWRDIGSTWKEPLAIP